MAEEDVWDEADAYDSSDEDAVEDEDDWDRTMFAKKPTVGKRESAAIIANQMADRGMSKRNYRKLEFSRGAPSSQDSRTRVAVTWDSFYSGLRVDVTSCPTGENIFRYIDTMTRHVKTDIPGKNAPSLLTILGIWEYLITILTFRHRDLKEHYGSQDVLRINLHLNQIAESWLRSNLAEGCLSWDRTIYKNFALVLQSGLTARCGDIGRSEGKPVSHAFAKELLAGIAGAEVDKLAEANGLDFVDRDARDNAEHMYDEHYIRGQGADQYDPNQYGPPEGPNRY